MSLFPDVFELQGGVVTIEIKIAALGESVVKVYESNITSAVIGHLYPSTPYIISLTLVMHGGATITSESINVTTNDGGRT